MRDILYRGKRIDNNEYVEGDLLQIPNGRKFIVNNMFGACIDKDGNFINTEAPFVCEVIPETVGQFTGLYDINGEMIFEDDILKITYDDGSRYTTKVRAFGNTLCVDIEDEDYNFTAIDFAADTWRDECCEVEIIDKENV